MKEPRVILLSFDVEEFDLPREHGADISLKEGVKVSTEGLERILKVLKETDTRATFFCTGNFAKEKPRLIKRMLADGHEIACHGVDHFKPCKTDMFESKKMIEKIIEQKVVGYRQPRMQKIDYKELKKRGYKYDSSVNPAFIPGRYNNLKQSRTPFKKENILEIPVSVATCIRIPLFWLALHLFPIPLYMKLARMSLKKTGYFATYFHPWEFANISKYKMVPKYIRYNGGEKLVNRLEKMIKDLKKRGCEFKTYAEFAKLRHDLKRTKSVVEKIETVVKDNSYLLKPFLVLCAIYLFGISAIILAGVHYADDVARTNYGYAGWNGFSRYASTIIAYGLHADGYLTNIAPLPQVLAVVMLALASILLICLISSKEIFRKPFKKWIWQIVAVVPLGLSPYMLECLSYQYDAPYMALSVLAAVLPLIFRRRGWWIYGASILFCILLICTTYQAAVGIFPMVVIMVAVKEWSEGKDKNTKDIIKFVVFSAVICLAALVIFQKLLMKPRDAYVSNSLPEIGNLFGLLFEHLKNYFDLMLSDFKMLWKVLLVLMVLGFEVLFVYRSKKNKIVVGLMGIITMILMGMFAFFFYAILEKPLFATRAMYPVGVFIAILGVYIMSKHEKVILLKIPVVVLVWCFFVFAFTYGNALREQDTYRNQVINMVIDDLNELPVMANNSGTMKTIQVIGNLGYSPVVLHMSQDYKVLQRLLAPSYSEYVPWMAYKLVEGSGLYNVYYDGNENLEAKDLPVLKETVLYKIYGDNDNILVEFKDERKFDVVF